MSAWAADAVPPAGAVPNLDQIRPAPELKKGDGDLAAPDRPLPREIGKPLDDITLSVKRYVVDEQAPPELKAAIERLTAPFTGPDRSYEDLMNAVGAVIRFLQRDMGLYLGHAYLPEQQPVDGVVRIAVMEGRLDQVILKWRDDIPVDREVVQAHLDRLVPGSVLRVDEVERVVFLLNDLRGLTARFEIKQGRVPGTASLVVTPTPEKTVSGRVEFDANGSRFSGVHRLGVTTNVIGPLKRGDGVVLSAQTTDSLGLNFLLAGYTLPLGSNGLKVGTSVSKVQYKLSDEVPLELNGDATAASVYALYPLVRSRNLNLFAQTSLEARDFIDRKGLLGSAADATKRSQEVRVGLAGDVRDNWLGGGVSSYDVSLISSRLTYTRNGSALQLLEPTQRTRMNMGLSRLNNLVTGRLLTYFSVTAQAASTNLDTTEQFSLGGPGRVRAYAPGEATGDQGVVASAELRVLPSETFFGRYARDMVFSAFYDWGQLRYKHDASREVVGFDNHTVLSGYGVGLTMERAQQFAARMSLAWPMQGVAASDTLKREPRVYASFTKPF